ncbi:hypothetical protein HBI37_172020 [Parastagonospora nodorum]|nr:hypothetical protein HBI29_066470 [Parastagonospora nodorum]KAH6333680.1 hypothetical protein HBI37_172020 [Parastagonospora nodorum]KAH6346293.1 hypothetical protein HBI36_154940 [Parastagonospora nodorum]
MSSLTPANTRILKRRKVALACNSCRVKKSRCDGLRPACSGCLELRIYCDYERTPLPQHKKPTYAQLLERVKELEAELASSTAPVTEPTPLPHDVPIAEDESSVDAIASNAFNETPEKDIGYFGPTSNHALFGIVSAALIRMLPFMRRSYGKYGTQFSQDMLRNSLGPSLEQRVKGPARFPDVTSEPIGEPNMNIGGLHDLCRDYFATIGHVVPYLIEENLFNDGHNLTLRPIMQTNKAGRALLDITCAHAAFFTCPSSAELYYRRTLRNLEGFTLRGSSIELVQTLLLLCLFQQNTQRSIASWTYHALAVKAAYQLGLHSSTLHNESDARKRALLLRVWCGVVNQDRSLSIALGRPCLISSDHVRIELSPNHIDAGPRVSHAPMESQTTMYSGQIM